MKKRLLRVVGSTGSSMGVDVKMGVFMVSTSSMNNLESKVIIHHEDYKEIFGIDKQHMTITQKQMCIVKIKTRNGFVVYRECVSHPQITTPCAAVTRTSFSMLNLENEKKPIVELSKSNRWAFFWHHPVHTTRVTTRLAIIGIIVTILGTLIGLVL